MRKFEVTAKLAAEAYGSIERPNEGQLHSYNIGEMRHARYGGFTIGATMQTPCRLVILNHNSGKVSLVDMTPVIEQMALRMMQDA